MIESHILPQGPTFISRPGSESDAAVIREIFLENVYRVEPSDCRGTVIDCGANIGAFSVFVSLQGAERVIAVEPEPENVMVLGANIAAYPWIQHVSAALWRDANGVQMLPTHGSTRIAPDGPLAVPSLTLPDLFQQYGVSDCAVVKMDIEGSEYPVLAATPSEVLARIHYLTIEFHTTDAATFGTLMAHLSRTHAVQTLGSYERGGYVYARKY